MLRLLLALCLSLGTASCGDFPKDADSTLERVKSEHVYRVGIAAPAPPKLADPTIRQMLEGIFSSTTAAPKVFEAESETLLIKLEKGELDLVIGRFEKGSPWASRVTMGPQLRAVSNDEALVPVMRNGENAWIALIERHARDASVEKK